jgi:hypothetical protein
MDLSVFQCSGRVDFLLCYHDSRMIRNNSQPLRACLSDRIFHWL